MKDIVIIGGGCLARIAIDMIEEFYTDTYRIIGYTALEKSPDIKHYEYLGNDAVIESLKNIQYVINCVGTDKNNAIRRKIYENIIYKKFKSIALIDPSARISRSASIGENVLIMKNVSIGIQVKIGNNVIIYPNAAIDHDCVINNHVHICPGVVMAGNVVIKEAAFLGIASVISNKIEIGQNAVIGAGAVVIKNIGHDSVYKGFRK